MNFKEIQNRKYLVSLVNQLNENLKGLLNEDLQSKEEETLVRILIDPKYWKCFGIEEIKDEFPYLEGFSKETYWFVVNRIKKGRANLYFSVESYLSHQMQVHRLQSIDNEQHLYFSKYKVKYNLKEKNRNQINEIVDIVYRRLNQY